MMKDMMFKLWKEEEGQGLVEYSLIIALVSVALVGALGLLAGDIGDVFANIGETMNPTPAPPAPPAE